MEHSAWKNGGFSYPSNVPTMISSEERDYLYWLGRSVWSGGGNIVEIGPWLGGSTICLAAGMQASGHAATARLHSYDNFIWRAFMAERAPLEIDVGRTFESSFRENVSEYDDIVVSYARALPDEVVGSDALAASTRYDDSEAVGSLDELPPGPLEILFIDGAKSWLGMCHLLKVARARLVPGNTLLVCQDFKYWGTYWVPVMMSRIGACLTPVHNVHGSSTVTFRLDTPPTDEMFDSFEEHVRDLDTDHTLKCIADGAEILMADGDLHGAMMVRLCAVSFLSHKGDVDAAVSAFQRAQSSWPLLANPSQLERARRYLSTDKSRNIPRTPRIAVGSVVQKVLGKVRRR